jgi:hypothetical protein
MSYLRKCSTKHKNDSITDRQIRTTHNNMNTGVRSSNKFLNSDFIIVIELIKHLILVVKNYIIYL